MAYMANFSFVDAVEISGVARARLQRLADAGIIQTAGGGAQGKPRRWSMRNLAEARVCDVCREFGVNEEKLRLVVQSLNSIWDQPDAPLDAQRPGLTFADATVLLITFVEFEALSNPDLEKFIADIAAEKKVDPKVVRAAMASKLEAQHPEEAELIRGERSHRPLVVMYPMDDSGLIERVTGENAGHAIVIQLAKIIREIEAASGEVFDLATALKRALEKELARRDKVKDQKDHD